MRAVQPVLMALERDVEEAAESLGARPWTIFRRIILPALRPAILAGVGLAFGRAVGEFGSIVLISGNLPYKTEVASVLVFGQIESDNTTGRRRGVRAAACDLVRRAARDLVRRPAGDVAMKSVSPARQRSFVALAFGDVTSALALGYLAALLVVPVGMVFYRAFEKGFGTAWDAVTTPPAQHAFYLTIMITLIAVPLNAVFGVLTAWVLARYDFRGKRFLDVLIDLPFAVSPVVVGLALILVWGSDGWFGSTSVIFSVPGMILATIFVSLPFVVREVLPVLEEEGTDQEQAASTLGARGWQVFWRITLPTIRWGLTYGVILSTARAIGEFGAVAVVSGKISGRTETHDPVRGGPLPVARPHRRLRCRRGAGDAGHLRADADDPDPTTTRKDLNVAIEAREHHQALRRLRRARRRQRDSCRTAR